MFHLSIEKNYSPTKR